MKSAVRREKWHLAARDCYSFSGAESRDLYVNIIRAEASTFNDLIVRPLRTRGAHAGIFPLFRERAMKSNSRAALLGS